MLNQIKTECAEFYHTYINELSESDPFTLLKEQKEELIKLIEALDEEQGVFRYATGKWSLKEVVGHMIDTERVFTFRAMSFARNDPGPFPGMDENSYTPNGFFNERTFTSLLSEYAAQREATLAFFASLNKESLLRNGVASDSQFSVRSFLYIITGHERHHINVLKERYLNS